MLSSSASLSIDGGGGGGGVGSYISRSEPADGGRRMTADKGGMMK